MLNENIEDLIISLVIAVGLVSMMILYYKCRIIL